MSTDPDRPAVPGLEPADAPSPPDASSPSEATFRPEEHPRVVEPARGLDMSKDPDRFDPSREPEVPELPRDLDPKHDPDRYRPPGQGQTLTDLLGKEGSQEGERDNYQWALGLVGVFVFLGIVAFLFNNVLTP